MRPDKLKWVLAPVSVPCFDYTDEEGNREKRTVIIAPISIEEGEKILKIGYACNRSLYCHDGECRYSANRDKKRNFVYSRGLIREE